MAMARTRRGSVLLMAIGLLTIVAILASTFLIVSNLDAQQTKTLAVKAQADPLAQGGLVTVLAMLAEDKYINEDGPYGKLASKSGARAFAKFVDATGKEGSRIDEHLGDVYDPRQNPDIGGTRSKVYKDGEGLADTDGDSRQDAPISRCYPELSNDETESDAKFRISVQVVDQGGRICLNTAGRSYDDANNPRMPGRFGPATIGLHTLFGGTNASETGHYEEAIHPARCGDRNNVYLSEYDQDCGRRLLDPTGQYRPFDIGDEPFLLWGESIENEPITNTGRLFDTIGPYLKQLNESDPNGTRGDEIRRVLTTYSCVSAAVRHPNSDDGLDTLTYLDPQGERDALYERMLAMLKELKIASGDPDERKKMAAHFVANLWAYVSPGWTSAPWDFSPSGEGFTVYGLKQDLVITEAFAKHIKRTKTDKDDGAWGYAIELMNPTGAAVSLSGYELQINGTPVTISSGAIPAGTDGDSLSKAVLYYFNKGEDSEATADELFMGVGGNWYMVPGLDFSAGSDLTVRLVRRYDSQIVPVDEIRTTEDMGYVRKNDNGPTDSKWWDIRRDDRVYVAGGSNATVPRAKYNLPYYKKYQGSGEPTHELGKANTESGAGENWVNAPNGDSANYSVAIHQSERQDPETRDLVIGSIGELSDIYLTGPIDGGKGFPQRVVRKNTSSLFQDSPTRGRLAFCPDRVSYGGYSGNRYPDVPAGALYGEFFTNVMPHERENTEERGRLYGLLNVNTASREALLHLPWPEFIPGSGQDQDYRIIPREVVQYIMEYRQTDDRKSWYDHLSESITGLRASSQTIEAYLTPGEVAIPLARYMDEVMVQGSGESLDALKRRPDFVRTRHALYSRIADCVSTRSDVYAVYVQIRYGAGARYKWNYVAVVDRSNMVNPDDSPAVLLFSEVHSATTKETGTGAGG